MKKLYRSNKEAMLGGVCGGIAEYFAIDPVIVRLLFGAAAVLGGSGILLYFICWVLIPEKPRGQMDEAYEYDNRRSVTMSDDKVKMIIGFSFIGLGVIFFMNRIFPWFSFDFFWPAILIIIGALILMKGKVD